LKGRSAVEYLNVFATKSEIQQMKDAASTPYMMVGGHWPESPQEACHRIALSHGLPEITGYYGCDLRSGEFVKA
jgi:hypothetical protein